MALWWGQSPLSMGRSAVDCSSGAPSGSSQPAADTSREIRPNFLTQKYQSTVARETRGGQSQHDESTKKLLPVLKFFRVCPGVQAAAAAELELELIQSHMAQKPVLRDEVGCACVAREAEPS